MSIITLILCAMLQLSSVDSDVYYKKNLDPISIEGQFVSKKITKDYYVIEIKEESNKVVEIKLLKNAEEKKFFMDLSKDCTVVKKTGKREINIVKQIPGGFNVMPYEIK